MRTGILRRENVPTDTKNRKIDGMTTEGSKGVCLDEHRRRGEGRGTGISYTVYTMARQSALRLIHEKDRRGRLAGDLGSYCASREG